MIGKHLESYCCEDISLIENYDKAMADNTQVWDCHHRLEIQEDKILTIQDLKNLDLYFHRPANELIFLTHKDHAKLHGDLKSDEMKEKMSRINKGRKFSEEHRRKLSEFNKTRVFSKETRQKISEANKGKKHSEESKKQMSDYWKNNGHPMSGKHHSEEAKKKMSEKAKGRIGPNRGKKMSEETKKKISETKKKKNLLRKNEIFTNCN